MTVPRPSLAWLAFLGLLTPPASAQVAFQPNVNAFPNGVTLSATPVVSADRRYVRLGMSPQFTGLEGFDAYSVPAAVTGGGLRSVDAPGAAFGMDGPVGSGFNPYGYGFDPNTGDVPGFRPTGSPEAAAFLAGGLGVPPRQRLSAGMVSGGPRQKAVRKPSRGQRGRASR